MVKSGATRVSIPLTQAAPLSVSQTELYSNSIGESFILSVIASGEWNVKSNDSWISAEKNSGEIVVTTLAMMQRFPVRVQLRLWLVQRK